MPIYEYRCESCDEVFEEYLSSSTAPAPPCPSCSSTGVRRVYSQFATEWKSPLINWHRMPTAWGEKPPKKNF